MYDKLWKIKRDLIKRELQMTNITKIHSDFLNLKKKLIKKIEKLKKKMTLVLKKINIAPNFWGTRFPKMREIMSGVRRK